MFGHTTSSRRPHGRVTVGSHQTGVGRRFGQRDRHRSHTAPDVDHDVRVLAAEFGGDASLHRFVDDRGALHRRDEVGPRPIHGRGAPDRRRRFFGVAVDLVHEEFFPVVEPPGPLIGGNVLGT